MSDIREELLGGGVNKKRVIGVILVALLLVSVFAFSTFFISFIFGTQRLNPNREKAETEYEDADLTKPPLPAPEAAPHRATRTPELAPEPPPPPML